MKIVIANSIGKDKYGNYIIHSPSRWSEAIKSRFHWFAYYPWELAYLSSLLKHETKHNVKFIDGCLLRLDQKAYGKHIIAENPDMLIIESATRMIDENVEMALKVKAATGAKLIFAGPHASAFPRELIDKGIDYVCVGEYELTVLEIVQSKKGMKSRVFIQMSAGRFWMSKNCLGLRIAISAAWTMRARGSPAVNFVRSRCMQHVDAPEAAIFA